MWTWIWFVAFVVVSSMYYKLYKKILDNDKNIEKHNKITQLTIWAALASCGDEVKSNDVANAYIANLEVLLKQEDFLDVINSLLRSRNIPTINQIDDINDEKVLASIINLRNSIAESIVQVWSYLDNPEEQESLY